VHPARVSIFPREFLSNRYRLFVLHINYEQSASELFVLVLDGAIERGNWHSPSAFVLHA